MQLRASLITADPSRLEEAVRFVETDARKLVEDEPGNLGMSLKVNSTLGVALVHSFWVSADAMRESDKHVRATRETAADRAGGTVSAETYRVASVVRVAPWVSGGGVRVTRADAEPSQLDTVVAAYEDTAVPWLTETAGFCGALFVAQQRTGRTVSVTMWSDAAALAQSRGVAAAIRVDTAAAAGLAVRGLEEYSLLFSTLRPVPTE
ncbi:MAG: hypothetical protein ABW156_01345 [Jiangellaceae bacterium]